MELIRFYGTHKLFILNSVMCSMGTALCERINTLIYLSIYLSKSLEQEVCCDRGNEFSTQD
jgi:hypothetical protein